MINQTSSYSEKLKIFTDKIFNNPNCFDIFIKDVQFIADYPEAFKNLLISDEIKLFFDGVNNQVLFNKRTENSFYIPVKIHKKNKKINKLTLALLKGEVSFIDIEKEYKSCLIKEIDKKIQDSYQDELSLKEKIILNISNRDSNYMLEKNYEDILLDFIKNYSFLPMSSFSIHYDLSIKSDEFKYLLEKADDKTVTHLITAIFTNCKNDIIALCEENYNFILNNIYNRINKYIKKNNDVKLFDYVFNDIFNISSLKNYFMQRYMTDIFNYLNQKNYIIIKNIIYITPQIRNLNAYYINNYEFSNNSINNLNKTQGLIFYGNKTDLESLDKQIYIWKLKYQLDNLFSYKKVMIKDENIIYKQDNFFVIKK